MFWLKGNSTLSHLDMNKQAPAYKLGGILQRFHLNFKGLHMLNGSCPASQGWMPGRPSAPGARPPPLIVTAFSQSNWLLIGCSH